MSTERHRESRLPDDPAYWENLARRTVEAAFTADAVHGETAATDSAPHVNVSTGAAARPLGHSASPPLEWWRGISDAAFVLAASAVLALIGGSLLLDDRLADATSATHQLTGAFAPDDPLLRVLMSTDAEPPPASVLLRLVAAREEER